MRSSSSEREVPGAAWQWDGEDGGDAGGALGDVVGGGGDGPRMSRRGLLVGAGVLAAGGAVWAFGRSREERPAPRPAPPAPVAVSGPTPVWTYRGPEAMTPERLTTRPNRPLYVTSAGLQLLDPATGSPTRLLRLAPPERQFGDDATAARVVISGDRVFTTSQGHIDGRHLADPAADLTVALPEAVTDDVVLAGCDGTALYGTAYALPTRNDKVPAQKAFAVRITDSTLLWSSPADLGERLLAPSTGPTGPTGTIASVRTREGRTELVVRDAATGRQRWTAPGNENLRWCAIGQRAVHVPDGTGGLRALDLATGAELWTLPPARGENWRAMPPLTAGAAVFLPRDNGVVTAHTEAGPDALWSLRLPFLLDARSHPMLVNDVLYVPGPAGGGVCAVDAATGRLLWTFRDSGPGKDVWSLAADGNCLYAGHDDVLHALPLATV
ncbi:PQQ-binding-like beta-propeller repeat protein [Kitasatospora sp. NPDC059408]|uniref:outer membrane protein assembly factor BamB family protein n=1 Tax=Kitasatospora sp. NPDC059408 TaxID=3346823 RepID=UPI0036A7361D